MKKIKRMKSPFLLLACLLAMLVTGLPALAGSVNMTLQNSFTIVNNYASFSFRLQDRTGKDSYWTSAPQIYVDGKYICDFSDLNIPYGDNDSQYEGKNNYRGSKSVDPYTVFAYGVNASGNYDYVQIGVYCDFWEVAGRQHKVTISGTWRNDGSSNQWKELSLNLSADDPNEFKINECVAQRSNGVVSYTMKKMPKNYNNYQYILGLFKNNVGYNNRDDIKTNRGNSNVTYALTNLGGNGDGTARFNYSNRQAVTFYPILIDERPEDKLYFNGYNVSPGFGRPLTWFKKFGTVTVNGFPFAKNVNASTDDAYTKKVRITWEEGLEDRYADRNGKWYVFRKVGGTANYEKKAELDYNTRFWIDTDTDKKYYDLTTGDQTSYDYTVVFVPNGWTVNKPDDAKDLYGTVNYKMTRTFGFTNFQSQSTSKEITISWTMPALSDAAQNHYYELEVQKSENGNDFTKVTTIKVTSPETITGSYTDKDNLVLYKNYYYRLKIRAQEKDYYSDVLSASLDGSTKVTGFNASRGIYSNSVKLQWEVDQIGNGTTYFQVERRQLGNNDEKAWATLYSTSGSEALYSYDDNTVAPGIFYEYRISCWGLDDNKQKRGISQKTTDGFCVSTGTITGRISYGTGTAVDSVKVSLVQSSDDNQAKSQFYSVRVNNLSGGVLLPLDVKQANELYGQNQPLTFQMWLNFDSKADGQEDKPMFFDVRNTVSLWAQSDGNNYRLIINAPNGKGKVRIVDSHLLMAPNKFYNVTLSYDGNNNWSTRVIDEDGKMQTFNWSQQGISGVEEGNPSLIFGTNLGNVDSQSFRGYIDEVRIWTKALTDKELLSSYDHQLSGDEKDLYCYWNFDEGINNQTVAYDYSKTGGVPNNRIGEIRTGSVTSNVVPPSDAFGIFGRTDADGNYVIKGVPFTGQGTNYSVVPSMGVHTFNPARLSRFVSQNSLNHSGVDFKDETSFEVSGSVYYENTNYPVEGASLYVDGTLCSRDGEPITTDAQGNFLISVPIGDHFVQVRKQGHEFANNGRYPADNNNVGVRYTFEQPMKNLTFTDVTKVTVAGRVVGGRIESEKPLGMGQSKANIGQAVIKLTAGSYKMNVTRNVNGASVSYDNATDRLNFAAATNRVASSAYVEGGDDDAVRSITITTDPKTGEFAALLPPVSYTVKSVEIPSDNTITFDASKIAAIDASNPVVIKTDSVETGDDAGLTFQYNTSLVLTHSVEPTFEVKQKNADGFGEATYDYTTYGSDKPEKVQVYTVDNGKVNYNFGNPVFIQGNRYTFTLEGYELYTNKDDAQNIVTDKVPLKESTVTITNRFAAGQTVRDDANGTIDDSKLASNQLALDSLGKAEYTFTAGLPNITEPYTLGLNITYTAGDVTKQWSGNDTFKAVVLGELPSGSNFVTSGPDKVLMVLRDPPGSNSSAYYENEASVTESTSYEGSFVTQNSLNTLTKFGVKATTFMGMGAGYIMESSSVFDLTVGAEVNSEITGSQQSSTTTTTTQRVSTDDSEDYVGANGDVFIGSATNVIFGNARSVDIRKGSDGKFVINRADAISTGMEFGTGFNYTQNYVENTLLPNFEMIRDSLLHAPSEGISSNNTNDVIYVSKVEKDDEKFASDNDDRSVWGNDAVSSDKLDGPSYRMILPDNYKTLKDANGRPKVFEDKVRWYNQQIKLWKNLLASNEKAKIDAKNNRDQYLITNTSFSAGATVESSVGVTTSKETSTSEQFEVMAIVGGESGFDIQSSGLTITVQTTTGTRQTFVQGKSQEETKTIGYTLKEDGDDDALSVDIFNAPDGFGPIFITKGGQTSCPYEDRYVSKYYRPGTEISAATMQIEMPEIDVENAYATDVPSGGTANYTLIMRNNSETQEDVWFQLSQVDQSNPHGAKLTIDGQPLTDGRVFLVEAGKELRKQLQLTQTDQSYLDYDNIQLVLRSQCQSDPTGVWPVIADTVEVTAKFVPTCSDIVLDIPQRVVNSQTGANLKMTVKGYDRNFRSFRGFRIQYKGARDVDWKTAKTYVNADSLKNGQYANADVIGGASTDYTFDMSNTSLYPDQTYLFRALTICMLSNTETNGESDEIQVIKDMALPKLMGNASPANGILTSDGEIAVNFNENIKASSLNKNDNFIVTAKLNGYTVDHDVALQLNGAEAAKTNAAIDLSARPFAFNLWVKYTEAGKLLSHGSTGSGLTLSVDKDGYLVANIAGKDIKSEKTLPKDKWIFMQVSYDYASGNSKLSADAAYDATDVKLISNASAPDYGGNGSVILGGTMKGAVQEVSLWDNSRSWAEAQLTRSTAKRANTRHLIGYWKLDEGTGSQATDAARSRNMTLTAANWYFAAANKALVLNGTDARADINIGACSPQTDEDYTLEMWFRGGKPAAGKKATLFSVNGDKLAATFSDKGNMSLLVNGSSRNVGTADMLDSLWHHFALNVLADGSATVYVDGQNSLQFVPETPIRMQADNIVVGAMRKAQTEGAADFVYSDYMKGNVDEIRLWNARLTADVIKSRSNTRLEGTEPGLVAYYPFETVKVDQYNQAVVTADNDDHAANASSKPAAVLTKATVGDDAPGMKAAPKLQNVAFDFTASERRVVINLNETDEALEGTTVNITLRGVRDENDNLAQPVTWTAYVNRNQLKWTQNELKLAQETGNVTKADVTLVNQSGTTEAWTISGMPSWLTVDAESGSLVPTGSRTLHFTVPASVAIGHYDATIYVTGNRGIAEPLAVQLHVTGKKPEWNVDPSDFESSSVLVGQLQFNGTPGEDSEDIVAAFDENGTCIGVANPEYNQRYNRFFTFLTLYGNDETVGHKVHFRVWDASTGKVHAFVQASKDVTVQENGIFGTIPDPVILDATDKLEQTVNLGKKWQWLSLNVKPEKLTVNDVFAPIAANTATVKIQDTFASYARNEWNGSLTDLKVSEMYMVYMNNADTLRVTGQQLNPAAEDINLNNGWNWIGYTPDFTASPVYALAAAAPQNGDIVKDQYNFAIYQDYEWIGSLKSMRPGMGYMYKTDEARKFNYPATAPLLSMAKSRAFTTAANDTTSAFPEWNYHNYPNNMTVIAQIKKDGMLVHNAEVCVFDGDEVRGKIHEIKDWYFITVSGEGDGPDLTIKVAMPDGEIVTALQKMHYRDNAMLGTIDEPYIINLSATTGITEIGYGEVNIAPRRTSQNVTVTSGSVIKTINVFNMQGHLVKAEKPTDSNRATVDMGSMPSGIYIVDVLTADGKHTKARIVKVD